MRWIVETALRHRIAVLATALVATLAGLAWIRDAPLDVFPEFAPVLVEVQTEAPGLSTEEVESLISRPIEDTLNGVSRVATLRSKSVLGLSQVVLIFEDGTDLWQARQVVQERLAGVVAELPASAGRPVILPPLSATSRVQKIGVTSPTLSQIELTTLVRWTIRPRLMAVPGVANVAIWGRRDRQLQILVDPARLAAHDVTLDQVAQGATRAVALEAGGFVDTPNQRLAVTLRQTVGTVEQLARYPIAFPDGIPLRLNQVADVLEGHPTPIGDAVVNDGPGLLLIVEKQPWGNTLEVTRRIEEALDTLRPGLGDVHLDSTIFRPATFIEQALANLGHAMWIGCLMVVVVLFAFLYEWRTAIISVVAIPLSLLAAVVVLRSWGQTINTMVLAGLILALGEVVDDAIIDVENIVRRLRENDASETPRRSRFRVVLEASLEVRSAVVSGSLIVALVLLPVFFLDGLAGSFFRPLALAYVIAILSSLVVALTVTPALSLVLLPRVASARQHAPLVGWLQSRYRGLLAVALRRSRLAVPCIPVAVAVAALVYPFLGEEFLPDFKERDFLMHWVEKPGTGLDAMQPITVRASRELRGIEGVRNFGAHLGRAEVADEVVGPNFTELWISLDPAVDYATTVGRIQEVVDGYPGLYRDVLTYLKERVKEVLSGASATLVVRIYGTELAGLRAHAEAAADAMSGIDGVVDLHVEPQVLVPHVVVKVRQEEAAQVSLGAGEVTRAVGTLLRGTKVGEVRDDPATLDVVVRGEAGLRSNVERLRELRIATPSGMLVPLDRIADVTVEATPNAIRREGASRKIDVTCNIRSRDLGRTALAVEQAVLALPFAEAYHPEFLGEFTEQRRSRRRLLALSLVSLLAICVVLYSDFRSARMTLWVLLGVPFSLVGGVLAVLLAGGVISLGSLVGFVTVLGIAARNGILLVGHYRHLRLHEGMSFGRQLVERGAVERLAPILMTALTTMLALLPIVLGGSRPGQEIEHPMAVVIVGGLVTSTLLNLILVPALYQRYGAEAPRLASDDR